MPHLPIIIRRHPGARRMTLRLSPDGSEIRLTLPKRVSEKSGMAFVAQQQEWIERQIKQQASREVIPFAPGAVLPLFGQDCRLIHLPTQRGVLYRPDLLQLGGEEGYFVRRVEDWIKREARHRFAEMTVEIAASIGQRPASVTLRDTKSRWGSCSKRRSISLSWRLAFAPAEVARYVIVHEVAHLAHFDHSPAFWRVVNQLDPDWEKARDWLRIFGKTLHDYGHKKS